MEERPPMSPEPGPPMYGFAPPPPTPPPALPVIPWEQPGLHVFSAFFQTAGMLLSSPRQSFERVANTTRVARPLVFGLIVGLVGVAAETFWNLLLRDLLPEFFPWADDRYRVSQAFAVMGAATAPVWLPMFLVLVAALQHLFLFLVGGAKRGFVATFRVVAYSWVTMPLAIIPMCGQLAGGIWNIVLLVIGLSAVHQISTGRAAAAVLLPLILCCACVGMALALFGAAIFGALGAGG